MSSDLPIDFDYNIYRTHIDLSHFNNESLKIHYINHGKSEGRLYKLPDGFDTNTYKELNIDLQHFNHNVLISHYITSGAKENRIYKKDNNVINNVINKVTIPINNIVHSSGISRDDIVIVVARYNEDISRFSPYNNNLMVYNKGNDDINNVINHQYVKKVPNLGREAGTYCNFILDNYDNLPNYMIFTQGNPTDHISLGDHDHAFRVIDQIFHENKNYKFKYISGHKEPFDMDSVAHFGLGVYITPIELGDPKNKNELIDNIKHWVSVVCPDQTERSNELIQSIQEFPSETLWPWDFTRIFMKTGWYCTSGEAQKMRHEITRHNFDYSKIRWLIERPEGFSFGYGALFIVHKDNILKYSKAYWSRLFDSLQELLPGAGWGCERLWGFFLGEGDYYPKR